MEIQSASIKYLNKDKNFKEDIIEFSGEQAYEKAVVWGKKNLDNFHSDLVKIQFKKGLSELELNEHYNQSNAKYDIKGESHLEYYKNKHPENYERLVEISQRLNKDQKIKTDNKKGLKPR